MPAGFVGAAHAENGHECDKRQQAQGQQAAADRALRRDYANQDQGNDARLELGLAEAGVIGFEGFAILEQGIEAPRIGAGG